MDRHDIDKPAADIIHLGYDNHFDMSDDAVVIESSSTSCTSQTDTNMESKLLDQCMKLE